MKVWKSPVFYFGILLVVAVVALLAAPFVINWNGYRADLEAYGRKLTGRELTIKGDITARLFPWPKLTVEDVSLFNPPGLTEPEFARAARIVTRMSLGGLFQGNIQVESIDIENPVIGLERLVSGQGNWQFQPVADLFTSDVLARVKLDKITLRDGVVRLTDRRRGEVHQFDDFNASLAAPQIAGPWRMRSVSLYAGHAIDIGFNTGAWKPEEPLRFSLHVANADSSGFTFAFDGEQSGNTAKGEVRIEPASAANGKEDAEGQLRPMVFKSKVTASFDEILLDGIEIAPRDLTEGGTLMSGSASVKLGSHISASADLSAATLNLDELAGAEARTALRQGGILTLADALLSTMPKDLSLSGAVKVTALTMGGETLDNVALALDADPNAIRLKEISASLPGRSRALYQGVFFPGKNGAELQGSLALESGDLRKLVTWAWPETAAQVEALWTGSRGQFKMQTDLGMTASRLRLSKTEFEIDGERGSGEFTRTSGGREALDIRIDARRIDLDSFIAGDVPAFSAKGVAGLGGVFQYLVPHEGASDLRLTVQAGELLLNGVTASDVVLDLASGVTGFDLRALEIGSVGGARVEATGLILGGAAGPDGSIGIEAKAEDPRELMRMVGLISGTMDPGWASGLTGGAIKGTVSVKSKDGKPETSFEFAGSAGDVALSASGQIASSAAFDHINISGAGELKTGTSGRLMQFAGLLPAVDDTLPGRVVVTAAGTLAEGFMTDVQVEAYGGRYSYNGDFKPGAPGLGLAGKLALRSTDPQSIGFALGLPVASPLTGVLVLDSTVTSEAGVIKLPDLAGRIGQSHLHGDVALGPDRRITANLETGPILLGDLLAATFLNWSGTEAGLESAFASALPLGLTGEIWIKPEAVVVHDQFTAKEVQIGITAAPGDLHLALFGKDGTGRDALVELGTKGEDSLRRIQGKIIIPIDLGQQLKTVAGQSIAEGQGAVELGFSSEGRSPGGALAAMKGSGTYGFDGLKLLNLSPDVFLAQVDAAKDSAGLTAAFDALRSGAGLEAGKVSGFVTIDNGEVRFESFAVPTPVAKAEVTVLGELALAQIDATIGLSFVSKPDMPGLSVSYAGPPRALARSEDNTELATKLGVTIMQQGIDELERLQQEQARLAAEEEKQRLADEVRLQAYYAQRDELILRKREVKVHAELRLQAAERLRLKLEQEAAANSDINKTELKQRARELRVLRRLARLEREPAAAEPAQPKPKRSAPRKPAPVKKPVAEVGPVILVQPEGAPVVLSEPPALSPTQ